MIKLLRTNKLLLLFSIIITFTSCYQIDDIEPSIAPECCADDCNFVSLDEAVDIASAFMHDNGGVRATKSSELTIKECFSIKDKVGVPMLHVVNYNEGGFIIVAGDMRLKPIQAYSSSGFFDNNTFDYPLGLKIWLDGVAFSLNNAKEKGNESNDETKLAWLKYKKEGIKFNNKTRSLDPQGPPTEEIDTLVGPLITDYWHQKSPYNDSLMVSTHYYSYSFSYQGLEYGGSAGLQQPVVGCVPLAIARILRYHQKPNTYAWSSMPNYIPQTTTTRSFVKDVHYAIKTYAENNGYSFNYLYVPDWYGNILVGFHCETGVPNSFPVGTFMQSQYGFPAAVTEPFYVSSYGVLKRELIDYELPSIISGITNNNEGHAWICDGYHYNYSPIFDNSGQFMGAVITDVFHFCWGKANKQYDSWYLIDDVSMGGYDFCNYMKFTHHISEYDYWGS